jgi:predicted acyl esterase
VKLIDVYPDTDTVSDPSSQEINLGGYQQLVRGEPMRGKYRYSFELPEPFTLGKVTRVAFTMPDVNHTFRTGHRITVQFQSSWFPVGRQKPTESRQHSQR